ncbi:hypothetical protein D3C80_1663660 [compost metagenome]
MQLSTWHLRQHFAEILQHPILNLTIINNQQLDRDFLQLSLPADGFNAKSQIFNSVTRGNDYGYIMHAAAPSGTP